MAHPTTDISRRTVIRQGGVALAACSLAPLIASNIGCDAPDSVPVETHDGWLELALSDYPELASVGGLLLVDVADKGLSLIVVRVEEEGDEPFVALDAVCTHAGCTIDGYDSDRSVVLCPCHGSEFELDGGVAAGPAEEPLVVYPNDFDGEILQIDVTDA